MYLTHFVNLIYVLRCSKINKKYFYTNIPNCSSNQFLDVVILKLINEFIFNLVQVLNTRVHCDPYLFHWPNLHM